MTYTNRRSFAVMLRKARQAGTIREYAKHSYGFTRIASLADGTFLLYKHPWMLSDPCDERVKGDDDGREYDDPRRV